MDTQPVWDSLASIPLGTVVAWISVIAAIVSGIWIVIMRLFKVFNKYRNLKDENENQTRLLAEHEQVLAEIRGELGKISSSIHNDLLAQHDDLLVEVKEELEKVNTSLNDQKEINFEYLKHSIVIACRRALDKQSITAEELQSMEDMYREYVEIFNGNGYVKAMVQKVEKLPVIGVLEE